MKLLLAIGIPVVLILGAVLVVALRPAPPELAQQMTNTDTTRSAEEKKSETPDASTTIATGRYETYDVDLIDDSGYSSTILFFYAAWCPECRAYDQAITSGSVPDGTQVLRVTYDDAQDLRQEYGVTIQSTFVRVNSSGEKQVLWNGYGKDKSVEAIIENTK